MEKSVKAREYAEKLNEEGLNSIGININHPPYIFTEGLLGEDSVCETYRYMLESNILRGCSRALKYNMCESFFKKIAKNGLGLSPILMKEHDKDKFGKYFQELNDQAKKFASEALELP